MAIEIVKEIVEETKLTIAGLLPDFSALPYERDIEKNSERELSKRYGFIPLDANFKEGSALGFTTMEHNFQLILTDDYQNKDDETAQFNAEQNLYAKAHMILKDIQKSRVTLPTSGYRVLLISGIGFDAPEHFDENSVVVLRANFLYTYRFRNN
jgi:hypothetical protein